MVVYVEANFVLEHALQQEQNDSCEHIVKLTESKKIALTLPAFALAEPYQRLKLRENSRNKLSNHFGELKRSEPYQSIENDFGSFVSALKDRADEEQARFKGTIERLLASATIIALDRPILEAVTKTASKFRMTGQDAIMFASVLNHLRQIQQRKQPKSYQAGYGHICCGT